MSKFAEKVYRKINKRTCEVPIDDIEKECIAIIDIALKKQRQKSYQLWWESSDDSKLGEAILNAEVEEVSP